MLAAVASIVSTTTQKRRSMGYSNLYERKVKKKVKSG